MRFSVVSSAVVAAIIGVGGTMALLIQAAHAVGATHAETASWVTAMCLAVAVESAWLSWRTRMPIIAAWSTAGSALIAASTGYGVSDTIGAFVLTALALIATGLFGPLTRLISRIPASVASGMLAGIIVGLVTAAFKAMPSDPWLILPLIVAFFVIRLFNPALSVLAVLVGGGLAAWLTGRIGAMPALGLSTLVFTRPSFTPAAAIGLALPLYLVTMASQNLSGLAVLRAAGYQPRPGQAIFVTGLVSLLVAPFGALTTNLAAISAAICTGPDAHPDPAKRWLTGPFYAACYLLVALFGASLVALFAVLPPGLLALVAGLALMAPLGNAFFIAMREEAGRTAAVAAFAVTASGLTFAGIGSAFWGLVAGLAVVGLERLRSKALAPMPDLPASNLPAESS